MFISTYCNILYYDLLYMATSFILADNYKILHNREMMVSGITRRWLFYLHFVPLFIYKDISYVSVNLLLTFPLFVNYIISLKFYETIYLYWSNMVKNYVERFLSYLLSIIYTTIIKSFVNRNKEMIIVNQTSITQFIITIRRFIIGYRRIAIITQEQAQEYIAEINCMLEEINWQTKLTTTTTVQKLWDLYYYHPNNWLLYIVRAKTLRYFSYWVLLQNPITSIILSILVSYNCNIKVITLYTLIQYITYPYTFHLAFILLLL